MRRIVLILTLFCLACVANANEFMFKHLEVKDGISNNQVLDIYKDTEGFMWFATASGLNRYDGYQVTVFRSYETDAHSLPDNYIKSIQEDDKGNLWILTGEGYAIYDPASEIFNRDVRSWLWEIGIDGTPALVYVDHNKNMWFYVEGKGCFLYMPQSQLLYPLLFDAAQLPAGDITAMTECKEGILLAYNTGRLICLDINTNKIKWQQDDLSKELGADKYGIFTLFVDEEDDIWIYSPFGLWVYNPEQKKWLSRLGNLIKRQSSGRVHALAQDKQGRIWIGKDKGGIDILDKETGEVRQLRNKPGDERSLQDNTVMALYEDADETMWVGTNKKGVSYYNESAFKFGIEYMGDIRCMEEDRNGCVWLGTDDAGIIYWNTLTGERSAFPQKNSSELVAVAAECMLKADDGKLWVGTFGGGLVCYDNGRTTFYKNISGQKNSLAHNNVGSLTEDKEGNIWIGTLGGGVQSLNPATGLFTAYNVSSAGILSDYVSSLCMGKDKELWIGTAQGLSVLDMQSGKVTNLTGTKSGKEHFSNQNINQVYEDSRGLIWIGTREGLNVYNPKTDELYILEPEQGLSSSIISGIVEDGNTNVWVTTARGVTNIIPVVDSKTGHYTFRNYIFDDRDGLQNCEFNRGAIKKLSSGEILMGGLYGVNCFYPDDIKYNKILPKVVFTRFLLFGDEVKAGWEYGGRVILDKAINRVEQLELNSEQNMFTIQFTSDNYILPEKVKYAYRMEGFNDEWLSTASGKVTYTNLTPGTYTLKVKAINGDGYSGDEEASLKIVIRPPFWLSVWAYMVYGLLLVVALILARQLMLRKERNKFNRQLMEQEEEKNREIAETKQKFFANISQELHRPLTLILASVETLVKEYPSDNVLVDKLNAVQRYATEVLNMVNQWLDFRKNDAGNHPLNLSDSDVVSCLHTVCDSFTSVPDKKNTHLTFYSAIHSLTMSFDEEKIVKVMMNLLSNAFKFTPDGGRVEVAVDLIKDTESQEMLEIKVSDTGIGINDKDKERIFERFSQIDHPDAVVSGSGIGLSMVRDFVMLHGGTVKVMDNAPVGSIFVVHIPVKRSGSRPIEAQWEEKRTDNEVVTYAGHEREPVTEEPQEEGNHIITIECLDEEIRKMEEGDTENSVEEIDTISTIGPQRATVIQLIEEGDQIITHVIPPEELPEVGTPASAGRKSVLPISLGANELKVSRQPSQTDPEPGEVALSSMDEKLIDRAVKYVEDNVSRSDLSVEELSHQLGMSRVHLYKKLLAITGRTPIEFIRVIRLKRAARLLCESQQNISEIAYQVGFNNPKYFSKYFKEEFGMLPSVYQEKGGR